MDKFHPCFRFVILALTCTLFHPFVHSQQADYSTVFGKDYTSACRFIDQHHWIRDSLTAYVTDPCTGLAVVFPELIRYSSIHDKMEIRALQTLYVQYGRAYADFSVGHFQIKPSFAEDIEKEYIRKCVDRDQLCTGIDTSVSEKARKERITRLTDILSQVKYLAMFLILLEEKYSCNDFPSDADRLIILATAYNSGFMRKRSELESLSAGLFFHTGILPAGEKYNYAQISADFYERCRNTE